MTVPQRSARSHRSSPCGCRAGCPFARETARSAKIPASGSSLMISALSNRVQIKMRLSSLPPRAGAVLDPRTAPLATGAPARPLGVRSTASRDKTVWYLRRRLCDPQYGAVVAVIDGVPHSRGLGVLNRVPWRSENRDTRDRARPATRGRRSPLAKRRRREALRRQTMPPLRARRVSRVGSQEQRRVASLRACLGPAPRSFAFVCAPCFA